MFVSSPAFNQEFDLSISRIVQFSPEWRDTAYAVGLIKDFAPWHHLNNYKFHVDIDGSINSKP